MRRPSTGSSNPCARGPFAPIVPPKQDSPLDQIVGVQHQRERSLLIELALAAASRTGNRPIPMRGDFGDRPEMSTDRVQAHLLRNVGIRFDLAISLVRARGEPEPIVERNDDPLDLGQPIPRVKGSCRPRPNDRRAGRGKLL
jgi:hypothetical protein